MTRFNSPEKREAQRAMPCAEFTEETRRQLEAFGLSAAAIDELDRVVEMERSLLTHIRDVPDSRTRRKQIAALRDQLKRTNEALTNIDESVMRMHFDLWAAQMAFGSELTKFASLIDAVLERKGSAGNTATDLDVLVYEIAKVMVKHGVKPKRNGKQFKDIVSAVFEHIGEDSSSMDAAIKKAWAEQRNPETGIHDRDITLFA